MGRKKIEITAIHDERLRNITFNKRKAGLLKKAAELSMLCNIKVCLAFTDVYGNLINFFSPDAQVIEDFKNVQPYKRIYSFTRDDYPHFFGSKKNKRPEDGGDENGEEGDDMEVMSSDSEGVEKITKKVKEEQSQKSSKPKMPLKITIPGQNAQMQREMNAIKMIHGEGANNFRTKEEQLETPNNDKNNMGFQKPQQQTTNNNTNNNNNNNESNLNFQFGQINSNQQQPNNPTSQGIFDMNSSAQQQPQFFNYQNSNNQQQKTQDFEYNLKSGQIDSTPSMPYLKTGGGGLNTNFGQLTSQPYMEMGSQSLQSAGGFTQDKELLLLQLCNQMQIQQQELRQQKQFYEESKMKDLQLMKLQQLLEKERSHNNTTTNNNNSSNNSNNNNNNYTSNNKQQEEQQQQIQEQSNTNLDNNNRNKENNNKNQDPILEQENNQNTNNNNTNNNNNQNQFLEQQQQMNNIYMNMPTSNPNLSMMPPTSNPIFGGIGSNPGQGLSGFNFINSIGDGQGRQAFYQLQDGLMNPPTSNPTGNNFAFSSTNNNNNNNGNTNNNNNNQQQQNFYQFNTNNNNNNTQLLQQHLESNKQDNNKEDI